MFQNYFIKGNLVIIEPLNFVTKSCMLKKHYFLGVEK